MFRTEDSFSDADHVYSIFDPDADSVSVNEHCGSRTKKNLIALHSDLETLLDMAGFQPVPQDHIKVSQKACGLRGFNVKHPPPEALKIKMYYQRLFPVIVRCLTFEILKHQISKSHCAVAFVDWYTVTGALSIVLSVALSFSFTHDRCMLPESDIYTLDTS